jgi:hypothetical protein
MFIGSLLYESSTWSIFLGFRVYLRYLPFFLLPIAYDFKDDQIKKQLFILFLFTIIQVPITVFQRFIQYQGVLSGDPISGTLMGCSILSLYLLCAISLITSFYMNRKIALNYYFVTLLIFFFPTTLNESKSVIFFLPFIFLMFIIFSPSKYDISLQYKRYSIIKRILFLPILVSFMLVLFVPIYDHFMKPRWGYGIVDFFQMEDRAIGYLYKGNSNPTSNTNVGRIDSIVLAYQELSKDIFKLIFGFGAGNVTVSHFNTNQNKFLEYSEMGSKMTSYTNLFWEVGIAGIFIYLLFFLFQFQDALYLRHSSGLIGIIALSWCAVIPMIVLALFYKNLLHENMYYLFWYFSGIIASKRFIIFRLNR